MRQQNFFSGLFIRILFAIALLAVAGIFIFYRFGYSAALTISILSLLCIETFFFIRNRMQFYDKTILAILQNDYSAGFPEEYKTGSYRSLYELFHQMKERQFEQVSKETIYRSILDNIDTAILILEKEPKGLEVFLMNDYFSKYFGVPRVRQWEYLKNYLPSLCQEIEDTGFKELKSTVDITIDDKEPQTFMMQTSSTKSYNREYFVIILDSIQRVIEKKEKEAWVNLMKIISHELMNSLTPVRSLSQSIRDIVAQPELSQEDVEDIREGLSTIVSRTDHLQFFVENYRKLTVLPTPQKTGCNLALLISGCLSVMEPILRDERISVNNLITDRKRILVDPNQLEQVLINLITNSIHALRDVETREIVISEHSEGNRLYISISDNGKGVETEIRDKIFLPFFTTRKNGAGIGLTLSRNILEAHGGYLTHQSNDGQTEFVICLVNAEV